MAQPRKSGSRYYSPSAPKTAARRSAGSAPAAAAVAAAVSWPAGGEPVPVAPSAGRVRWRALRSTVPAYALFAAGYITYITFLSAYLLGRSASTRTVGTT
ncbi:hypothetical protein [Nocardia fusca]|uniref:hypothetical protein n=1 Tax=Nocardia fusca TaxID=941183 RepID=UPI0007A73976|nr:hypothetical protein [Nocardia fusca]